MTHPNREQLAGRPSTISVEGIAKIIRRQMQDGSIPATVRSERAAQEIAERMGATLLRASQTDPMERVTGEALSAAGIDFITDHEPESPASLDFYLPDADVHVEVKRFHSERVADQLRRAENVILLQGEKAVRFFAAARRQSPSVEEVARMIDDAPDEWSATELAQAIANLYAGREG